jgi:hypothetical protein
MKTAFGIFLMTFCGLLHAEQCSSSLIPDVTVIEKDTVTRVAFLKIVSEENYKELSKNGALSAQFAIFKIPFGGNASYGEFDKGRSTYYQEIKLETEFKDASNYLLKKVPSVAYDAYIKCLTLQAHNTHGVHIVPIAISDRHLTARLIWNPPPTANRGLKQRLFTKLWE